MWYYFTKLNIHGFISGMLFFSYSLLACIVYGLLTGTVGFLIAYAFVRRIYGQVSLLMNRKTRHTLRTNTEAGTSKPIRL